jgi:hypothetical protein
MGNLNNLYISQSFQSLAHLGTDTSLVPGTMTVLQDGIGQSLNISFDGTNISSSGNIYGANITASVVNTGSLVTTSSFNQYTQSTNNRLTNIESTTASLNSSVSQLNAATSSYVTETESGSFLLTASFDNGTRNLTFTKGNNTTFAVNIPDVSGSTINTASFATTGSNTFTGDQNIDAGFYLATNEIYARTQNLTLNGMGSVIITNFLAKPTIIQTNTEITGALNLTGNLTASLQQGYVWVGNASGVSTTVATSSFGGGGSVPAGTISGSAQITALGFVSSSVTASSLITASFNNGTRNLTFTKGDNTTFNVNIPDVSGSAGDFVTTSSFNSYTSSTNSRLTNIESTTASLNLSINQLNEFTESQEVYNNFIANRVGSLEIATASLFTSASNALVTASVSGQLLSFTKGNNSIFSVTLPTGSGTIVTGSYGAFQDSTTQSGSANTAYRFKFNTTDVSDGVILSGSTGLQVGAYGTYNLQWSGQAVQGSGAGIVSVWVNVNGIQVSGSRGDVTLPSNTKLLPAWTYLLTLNQNDVVELEWASDSGNTTWQYLPIGTTPTTPAAASIIASLNRVDVGGGTNSVSTSSFNSYTSSTNTRLTNIESTTASLLIETQNLELFSASALISISNLNQSSASQQISIDNLNAKTGSYATTGSNTFVGNQIISGTFVQSGSNSILEGPGGTGVGTHILNRVLISGPSGGETPRLYISGSDGAFTEFGRGFINQDTTKVATIGSSVYTGAHTSSAATNTVAVYNADLSTDVELQMFANSGGIGFSDWDNGTAFNYIPFMQVAPNTGNNPSPVFTRGLQVTGSTEVGTFTASLQQGFVFVGNASGRTTTVSTSSFGGGGTAFPFTGDAVITGSLLVSGSSIPDVRVIGNIDLTGSMRVQPITLSVSSNTASIDMNRSNYFILNLPTSSTTHVAFTNITPGESINLLVSQSATVATGSITFAPNIYFPGGNDYVATATGSARDIVSFITFNSNEIYATNVKNLR